MPQTQKQSQSDNPYLNILQSGDPSAPPQSKATDGDNGNPYLEILRDPNAAHPLPEGVVKDSSGRYGSVAPPSTLSLYGDALFNPVGSGAHAQGVAGGAEQVAGRAMQTLLSPVLHPLATLKGVGGMVREAALGSPESPLYNPAALAVKPGPLEQRAEEFSDEWNKSPALALENAGGDAIGTVEGGRAAEGAFDASKPLLKKAGTVLENTAQGNLNRVFRPSTKEILRDENPGRGMLRSGIGPTLSKGNLATKLENASDAVGSRIGEAVERADHNANAPVIQSDTPQGPFASSQRLSPPIDPDIPRLTSFSTKEPIEAPIQSAIDRIEGPGGTTPRQPYDDLRQSMTRKAPGATAPIYGAEAPETVLPSDLWKTIRNIDENTRFHTDPEVESVNETRRSIRGGLRPILDATDPAIPGLSHTYSDLQAARTAVPRSSSPVLRPRGLFGQLTDATINSTPVNTTISSGIYRLGRGLRGLSGETGGYAIPGFSLKTSSKPLQLESAVPTNATDGEVYSEGGFPSRGSVTTPAPRPLFALPAEAGEGEVQPMIGIRNTPYPALAEDFARTRVVPTKTQVNRMGGSTLPSSQRGLALPEPRPLFALPSEAGEGEPLPMIGIRANRYPPLAEDFARERIVPTKFKGPPENPFGLPKGLLEKPKPSKPKKTANS
jgi:hypothetical protein